ncbi:MAG: GTPase [Deltaproteobacteria bacterium]|nr:GTPase [Deltaproteobacteria bacterium]
MTLKSTQPLKTSLEQVSALLEGETLLSFSGREKAAAQARARTLLNELTTIEGHSLTVGLLGGTGVGKSSLMNALAGAEIATVSHRRPHTDHVLIYRFEDDPMLPEASLVNIPWHEVIHSSSRIKGVLLCDLPDFDSLAQDHRERVLGFLKQLDLLIWVTSPEKYADSSLYEFISLTAKAHQNFYFVLNKSDIFFDDPVANKGHEALTAMVDRFLTHLRTYGIQDPLVYTVSAKEAMETNRPASWNQFPMFRHQIFQERNAKQIAAIKRANLHVEADALFSLVERERTRLEAFHKLLVDIETDLKAQRPSWNETGAHALDLWLDRLRPRDVLPQPIETDHLIGPGRVLSLFMNLLGKGAGHREPDGMRFSDLTPPEEITVRFQRRLERGEDRITGRILSEDLPVSYRDRLSKVVDVKRTHDDLGERFFDGVALVSGKSRSSGMWGFRTVQYTAYVLLFVIFLLALVGENRWDIFLKDPGMGHMAGLIASMVQTLFSPKGLAALLTYTLLNLFLGLRFYRQYTRILDRKGRKRIRLIKAALSDIWNETLSRMVQGVGTLKKEVQDRITDLSQITETQNK